MINAKTIANQAAPFFLLLGLATIADNFIPGFTVPGNTTDWMIAAVACALVGKA